MKNYGISFISDFSAITAAAAATRPEVKNLFNILLKFEKIYNKLKYILNYLQLFNANKNFYDYFPKKCFHFLKSIKHFSPTQPLTVYDLKSYFLFFKSLFTKNYYLNHFCLPLVTYDLKGIFKKKKFMYIYLYLLQSKHRILKG